MADIRILVPMIKRWEGGFVNDPKDAGKATCKGVTMKTLKKYRLEHNLSVPTLNELKNISNDEWMNILKEYYWDRCMADNIYDQNVANLIVNWNWMSGGRIIKYIQKLVGAYPDGVIGEKTIYAINCFPGDILFNDLKKIIFDYIDYICKKTPSNNKFKKGWYNRINYFKYEK